MTSIPPANPTINQPPLVAEQVPPDITIPVYGESTKSKSPISLLFNILFFLFGIAGIGYGIFMQSQLKSPKPATSIVPTKIVISQPAPSIKPTSGARQASPSPTASSSALTDERISKETLCFTLNIPKKNDAGAENNCDISFRSSPDINNPETTVSIGITLNNNEYTNSQDMADQWLQIEKDHGSEDVLIEKGIVQVGGEEGYKVVTEYTNKAVQTTHIFVHRPGKYEAYGYPITGFELLSASDINTRPIQQEELNQILTTWIWK